MSTHFGRPRSWVPEDSENRLAEFRVAEGLTLAEMGRRVGVSPETIRGLELHRTGPTTKGGIVKPWVRRACAVLRRSEEDVFPREFCAWRRDEFVVDQLYGTIMSREPQDIDDMIDARNAIRMLYRAKPRLARVLWASCCGYTRDEIGVAMGLSGGRVAQLEGHALRWLRGPGRIGRCVSGEAVAPSPGPEPLEGPFDPILRWEAPPLKSWSERALWVRNGKVGPEPHSRI